MHIISELLDDIGGHTVHIPYTPIPYYHLIVGALRCYEDIDGLMESATLLRI